MIGLFIEGQPPKTTSQQKGVFVAGGKPRFFTKQKVQVVKDSFVRSMRKCAPVKPLTAPQSVEILICYAYTIADKKAKRCGFIPHDKRPDIDNLIKLLLDAMTAAGWFVDDSIVTRLVASKVRRPDKSGIFINVCPHQV